MANFFKRFGIDTDDPRMQRAALYSKFSAARMNILLLIVFSVINILSLTLGSGAFFLFTGAIPYQIVDIGMKLCGFESEEYYTQLGIAPTFDKAFLTVFILIAVAVLTIYLICWIFSKKRGGVWLKVALALVSADTMAMLLGSNMNTILFDAVFHIWLIVIIFIGISSYDKLRAMPREIDEPVEEHAEEEITESEIEDSDNSEE